MNKNKILKITFIIIFITFIISYIIQKSGYLEYNLRNKTILTTESMKQFEEDINNGLDVTIEDYVVNTNIDYTTKLTRNTNKISIKINKILKNGIENIFKILGKLVYD